MGGGGGDSVGEGGISRSERGEGDSVGEGEGGRPPGRYAYYYAKRRTGSSQATDSVNDSEPALDKQMRRPGHQLRWWGDSQCRKATYALSQLAPFQPFRQQVWGIKLQRQCLQRDGAHMGFSERIDTILN